MASISREEILSAFGRLGALAHERNERIELALIGGAAMMLAFGARPTTRDVDAVALPPSDAGMIRRLASIVGEELDLPEDWLNDGAKGFLHGLDLGPEVFTAPGITVRRCSSAQMLAMKLGAMRDDQDIMDARRLIEDVRGQRNAEAVWQEVAPFITPHRELKASYAFQDLWEQMYG